MDGTQSEDPEKAKFECPIFMDVRAPGDALAVRINLEDGSVTFGPGFCHQEAARLFWMQFGRYCADPQGTAREAMCEARPPIYPVEWADE